MRRNLYYNSCWLTICVLLHFLLCVTFVYGDKSADNYVTSSQSECFTSKRIFSCFRYRVARYIWSVASGHANLFQPDVVGPSVMNSTVNFVQLSEPSRMDIFPEAREISGKKHYIKMRKSFNLFGAYLSILFYLQLGEIYWVFFFLLFFL